MRKKLLVFGLCAVMAFSMTACGKSDSKSASDGQASSGEATDNTKADMQGTEYKSKVKLGDYVGLKVGESNSTATDDEVTEAINKILANNAVDTKYEEGTVANGDKANIDYEGKVDGATFDGGSATAYDLTIGSNYFIDGFESGLVGKNIGDTVDLNLTFPAEYKDANGNVSDLAGKAVVFTVKINYVTRSESPELSDEFVKEKCADYDNAQNVDELKEYVKKQLILNKKLTAVWQTLLDNSEIEYDEDEVAELQAKMKQQYIDYYAAYSVTLEDYLSYADMTEDEFDEQLNSSVKTSLKNIAIAMQIARDNDIKVTEEEYSNEVTPDIEANSYDSLEAFQADYPKQDTVDSLLYYDVLEWIADKCEVVPDSEIETTTAAETTTQEETTK